MTSEAGQEWTHEWTLAGDVTFYNPKGEPVGIDDLAIILNTQAAEIVQLRQELDSKERLLEHMKTVAADLQATLATLRASRDGWKMAHDAEEAEHNRLCQALSEVAGRFGNPFDLVATLRAELAVAQGKAAMADDASTMRDCAEEWWAASWWEQWVARYDALTTVKAECPG